MTARCPRCDRAECPRWKWAIGLPAATDEEMAAFWFWSDTYVPGADEDCRSHRVDWRAEALAARARIAEMESVSAQDAITEAVGDGMPLGRRKDGR